MVQFSTIEEKTHMINIIYPTSNSDFWNIKADILVNTVNCVGVMGKGIALEFKRRYPDMFDHYKRLCKMKLIEPGGLMIFCSDYPEDEIGQMIFSVATKMHWKDPSRYEWIRIAIKNIAKALLPNGIDNEYKVNIPPLGCGNGGLDWKIVKQMLLDGLAAFKDDERITINIFEPIDYKNVG